MLDQMKAFIGEKDMCVLATVSENEPHCSLMGYVTDEDCRHIFMVTTRETKKYQNLVKNPYVSLLIDTREEHFGAKRDRTKALTVEGRFQKMEDGAEKKRVGKRLLERHPHLGVLINDPDAEILCIKINSCLLLDGVTDAYFETL